MKGIKKLVIFFLFGIMLAFSVRAPLCESIDLTDSEVIIKASANNQYVIHNYTQAVVSEAEQQPFIVNKSNNTSAECKYHFFFNRSRQREGALFKQRARSMIQSVLCHRDGGIMRRKRTNVLICMILGGTDIWITRKKS
nr:MAG TPA: hypothetical protein [Caudoviricetes sp.]